jgi:hypothetical protein
MATSLTWLMRDEVFNHEVGVGAWISRICAEILLKSYYYERRV